MHYTQDMYYNRILEAASDLKLLCDEFQAARDEAIVKRDTAIEALDGLVEFESTASPERAFILRAIARARGGE